MNAPVRSHAVAHRVLPTPRRALGAVFEIREVSGLGLAALRACGEQLAVHPREGLGCAVVGAQPEDQTYVFTGYGNAASRNIKPAVMDGLRAQARASISR